MGSNPISSEIKSDHYELRPEKPLDKISKEKNVKTFFYIKKILALSNKI